MAEIRHEWAERWAGYVVAHPWRVLILALIITAIGIFLAGNLEMRMNWTDLLPEGNRTVRLYEDIQNRFGNSGALVVVLEGDYNRITQMAGEVEVKFKSDNHFRNVVGKLPLDFSKEHGFALLKPDEFRRSLNIYGSSDLIGSLKGLNNDYESEYTDSESNMRRDEVKIAQSLLGMKKALDGLYMNLSPEKHEKVPSVEETVDALMLGESWTLSLDRRMLLIICEPVARIDDIDGTMETAATAENLLNELRIKYPDVSADLTGMAKISQDEMNSIGLYTQILSLIAIILIYLLLVRSFKSWLFPMAAIIPLILGIIWTMALLYILYGGLNLFTAMMMLVLLGLGIDFSIHMVSRFIEEISAGSTLKNAIALMLGGTGVGVITGALTTAAAFLTLLTGKTRGVHEFGAAAGFGVLLTLVSIFVVLPPLLVFLYRKRIATDSINFGKSHTMGFTALGKLAESGWKYSGIYLGIVLVVSSVAYWGMKHIDYEYDFLELEAKGLKSVALQREIPKRFGMSDHAAWIIANSIEESRELKEKLLKLPTIGDAASISDYIPADERMKAYITRLEEFRNGVEKRIDPGWKTGDKERLSAEIDRLWDNLDLMSNLAYMSGLDRIMKVIDVITGTDTESGNIDKSAVLPVLSELLKDSVDEDNAAEVASKWFKQTNTNLISMSNPAYVSLNDLPDNIKRNHLPSEGDGYLMHIIPRKYMWDKELLQRFIDQVGTVSENVVGFEHLMILMMDETLNDGRKAAVLALIVITLLVLIHFRGMIGLLSLLPLAGGTLFMLGLMYLLGMKYNYMNLITVPIILGIGIDDGIHILHRWKQETGDRVSRISLTFNQVGRAIMLTSVTTMIGFGSIALYEMRGMASFGQVLFMGVGACFIATLFILPAVLRLVTRK